MKKAFLILTVSMFLFSGCALVDYTKRTANKVVEVAKNLVKSEKELTLKTDTQNVLVKVEIVDSESEREKGLMNRKQLKTGKGMWFIFENESPRNFWMKNMFISLDIIFFDSKKKVVKVVEAANPCGAGKCDAYSSDVPVMYVLEVPVGFVKANKVKLGDTAEIK